MIEHLHGTLTRKSPTEVVVECGGVGYLVQISVNTYSALPKGGEITLLTHAHYAENSQRLFGFATERERSLFRLLQGLRGVGPALAMGLLSQETPERLIQWFQNGETSRLTQIKGVGRKTAERLIVELRDRLGPLETTTPSDSREQVLGNALVSLGVPAAEAEERARQTLAEAGPDVPIEELLRTCLRAASRSATRSRS